jgi:hypothetical protein
MKQKTTLKSFLSLIIICLGVVSYGFGQVIFHNPITGDDINPEVSNPYTDGQYVDANIIAYGIGKGPGAVSSEGGFPTKDRYNLRGWNTETLNPLAYFEFIMEPNTGYEIDFSSFEYKGQISATGPVNFAFRSSLDDYTDDIGNPTIEGTTIDINSFQNITHTISFRIYAWGASSGLGTFSINDFTFRGIVSALPPCNLPLTTWSDGAWDNGTPNLSTPAIIKANYNTGIHGNFSTCNLTIDTGATLTINDEDNGSTTNDYILVQNHITVNGAIIIEPKAAFVQLDDEGLVNGTGTLQVIKETAPKNAWYEYTYWSSPVSGVQIGTLTDTQPNRRFIFNAQNYLDAKAETENNNTLIDGQDGIDDDGNDWQRIDNTTVMAPGVGYAVTLTESVYASAPGTSNKRFRFSFEGLFNNGDIRVPVYRNDFELNDTNWNLIGNPYPSAIDADLFINANTAIDGALYLWSQNTPPSSTANGNQQLNFSSSDYAIINGTGQVAGGDGLIPQRKIPSGQAFFVSYSDAVVPINITTNIDGHDIARGEVLFNNAMRVTGASDNAQFFKNSSSKNNPTGSENKIWINLTSDNGIFNQTLIGYIPSATNKDDGSYFDTQKNTSTGTYAIIYTTMDDSNKKFAIQGKAENSLNAHEIINIGFKTSINTSTLYTLSIAQLQGEFLTNNTIYLKDNYLDTIHSLSDSDYTFTSEIGEFNDRFEVVFNNQSVSTEELTADINSLNIIDLDNGEVKFIAANNLTIRNVSIFDLLGRKLYQFKGQNSEETYHLHSLKGHIYIAKVEFSNGTSIIKKAIKK